MCFLVVQSRVVGSYDTLLPMHGGQESSSKHVGDSLRFSFSIQDYIENWVPMNGEFTSSSGNFQKHSILAESLLCFIDFLFFWWFFPPKLKAYILLVCRL